MSDEKSRESDKKQLKIGIISPLWLPVCGGGEKYIHGLAVELISRGFDINVFCGTQYKADFDNGEVQATRFDQGVEIGATNWLHPQAQDHENVKRLSLDYRFMETAIQWAKATDIKIALICNPMQRTEIVHARELYASLRALGVVIGIIHLDLPHNIINFLTRIYLERNCSWEDAALITEQEIRSFLVGRNSIEGYYLIASPLFFSPDFIISCSEWNLRFINPLKEKPQLVLHPLLDIDYFGAEMSSDEMLPYCDVLMVNPDRRKGQGHMLDLMANADQNWTFRMLKGGWGNGLSEIMPRLEAMSAFKDGRVELIDYLRDIRSAYRTCGALFFPSLIEGYGMTTVEAMASRAPVVSSNYPAIVEAIGDGAIALCPLKTGVDKWVEAIRESLSNREFWISKGLCRVNQLRDRQQREVDSFAALLESYS